MDLGSPDDPLAVRLSSREAYEAILTDEARAAVAAERERLMEVVCVECGKSRFWQIANPTRGWCYTCNQWRSVAAYAEYLRLHPEAEKGDKR